MAADPGGTPVQPDPTVPLITPESLFAAMSDLVLVLDRDGRYVTAAPTQSAINPRNRERARWLVGKTIHEALGDKAEADRLLAGLQRAFATGETQTVEYRVDVWGDERWFSSAISVIDAEHALYVARDITETARSQRRLEQSVDQRSQEIGTLLEISRALSSTIELTRLLETILDQLKTVIPYDGAGVDLIIDGKVYQQAVRRPKGFPQSISARPDGMRLDSVAAGFRPLLNNEAVYISDTLGDSPAAVAYRESWGGDLAGTTAEWVRSMFLVPMSARDELVGFITVGHHEPAFFTDDHLTVIQSIAGQAAAVVQNARLFEETQRRARESEALLEVSRGFASTLELEPLLELVLDHLQPLMGCEGAGISLIEGSELRQLAVRRPPGLAYSEAISPPVQVPAEADAIWRKIIAGESLIVADVLDDTPESQAFRAVWNGSLEGTPVEYMRGFMAVPLISKASTIGLLNFGSSRAGYFTLQHLRLVQGIAGPAAAAIENARLFKQTQSQAREMAALANVSGALSSTLELKVLINLIIDELKTVVPYSGAGVDLIVGGEIKQLAVRRPPGFSSDPAANQPAIRLSQLPRSLEPLLRNEPVYIPDVLDNSEAALAFRRNWEGDLNAGMEEWMRSLLLVPMFARDTLIGSISVVHSEPDFYRDEHIRMVQSVSGQAASAIENARLFEQTERRERELTALLEVSRTVASTLDAREVMGTILDQLGAVTEHTGSTILLVRDDAFQIVEARSITGARADVGAHIPFDVAPVLSEAMRTGRTVIIDDVRADEPMAADYRRAVSSVGLLDRPPFNVIRSWMAVPLALKDRVLGMLTISWTEPAYFTEDHARLARAFADQAAVAMENSFLFDEARRRAREFEVLSRADDELFRSLDLDVVLQALVDVTVDVLGAEKGIVTTWDAGTRHVSLRASRNISEAGLAEMHRLYMEEERNLEDIRLIVVEDPTVARPSVQTLVEDEQLYSYIQVPVISPAGEPLGFFSVGYTVEHHFSEDEQRLLVALAERAAVAISNADLHERAQNAASLEERQRLARELHDSVSQALYGIALGARTARKLLDQEPEKAIEPVEYILSLASAGMVEMRSLIFELRPESLKEEGLVAALTKQIAAVQSRHGLHVDAHLGEEPDISLDVKEALYRIAQEALHNIVKHAQASRVNVSLTAEGASVELAVVDDGLGFDPAGDYAGHLGLRSMRERAAASGGTLAIASARGDGVRLVATFPLAKTG